MRGLIIYHNKYSITKEYADYIASVTNLPTKIDTEVTREDLSDIDFIVVGCQDHFHHLNNEKFLNNFEHELIGKKIFLYTSSNFMQSVDHVKKDCKSSIPTSIQRNTSVFNFGGKGTDSDMRLALQMEITMGMLSAINVNTHQYYEGTYNVNRYGDAKNLIKDILTLTHAK